VRFTIVTAVYNVARYLPEFIDSIEKQTFPLDRVQVIAVDDGSEDDSLVLLKDWADRHPDLVTVLVKENGGQGSARNLALDEAVGEWITFTDADDMIDPGYLSVVDAFLTAYPQSTMVATNRIFYLDQTGELVDRHPLKHMLTGDRLVDLNRFPEFFHGAGNAAFFRREIISRETLRFDVRVQPIFEDGHFCVRYLLAAQAALVGFLESAIYIYRRRADGTSTVQTGLRNPGRYTAVPKYAYLDVLKRGAAATGRVPEWLQNMVLYELSWYFSQDKAMSGAETAARGDVAVEFLQILKEIAALLDPEVIEGFGIRRFDREWRDIMIHSFSGESWCTPYVVLQDYDEAKRMVRIAYRYVGERPTEQVLRRGRRVRVRVGKIRAHEYFEHTLLNERIAWVPADSSLRVVLNGNPVEVRRWWPGRVSRAVRPAEIETAFKAGESAFKLRPKRPKSELTWREVATQRLARTRLVQRAFGDAWVLIDRVHDADDNAERLFRHLRKRRRDINAWFVIERGTPDWNRLRKDGYKRVIPHGSLRWQLLMLNCLHLISSHADLQVDRPDEVLKLRKGTWKYTFLQHGVIKDDLSRWLNPKRLALFITSTPQEYASIVKDNTPYSFTTKEVKLTGMPRFDRLRELGASIKVDKRDLILVTPTWRHWLNAPADLTTHRRTISDDFFESEYAEMWLGFLRNDQLRLLAQKHNLRIGFLPHPNVQPVLPQLDLPAHVEPFTFAGQDIQRLIARAAVMVTDMSSMAFNAAYIDRPVVYFQFDAERVLSGAHVGRRGYFSYERDGFGPVTETIDETVSAVASIAANDMRPSVEYRRRIKATFPNRDGRCCERVVAAIEDLTAGEPAAIQRATGQPTTT
jgi:glycosyltransferase involved in cell wall biosynthesis